MDGHYLEDLKVMIRRGMAGVIREAHAGGRATGIALFRANGASSISYRASRDRAPHFPRIC